MLLSHRLDHIAPFHVMAILERARALEAAGHDVIHLEIGEPDFPTPEPVQQAAAAAMAAQRTFYTPALGLPELREAIAGWYASRYGVTVEASRIAVTPGASGALLLVLSALCESGRSVLLPDPTYPCNRHLVSLTGAEPVGIAVDAGTRYQLSAQHVDAHWRADTVAAMIASPSNPTGTLITPPALAELHEAVRRHSGTLIVDEIYHGLTYGVDAPTALALGDDIVVINSFSKYFQMTGWRLGWMVIPDAHVRHVEKLAQNLTLCPSTPAQYAALAAFTPETIALLETRRAEFRRRRDFLAPALEALGFRITAKPEGAFYLYCDCSALCTDSFTFARDLLEQAGVAATPGLDFGANAPEKHIRFAYTTDVDRLAEAAHRLGAYLGR